MEHGNHPIIKEFFVGKLVLVLLLTLFSQFLIPLAINDYAQANGIIPQKPNLPLPPSEGSVLLSEDKSFWGMEGIEAVLHRCRFWWDGSKRKNALERPTSILVADARKIAETYYYGQRQPKEHQILMIAVLFGIHSYCSTYVMIYSMNDSYFYPVLIFSTVLYYIYVRWDPTGALAMFSNCH